MQRHNIKCTTQQSISFIVDTYEANNMSQNKKKIKSKRQFLRKKQKLYLKIFHFKSYFPWHLLCDRYFYHDFSLSDFILDEFSPNRRHVSIANICTQPPFVQ